jgi:hypothetical protein
MECDDDRAAKAKAEQLVEQHIIELWDTTKFVARFVPQKSSGANVVRFAQPTALRKPVTGPAKPCEGN